MSENGDSAELFGITFASLTFDEVYEKLQERIDAGRIGFIVTPNVDHVCNFSRDRAFREIYLKAFMALPDGVPIIWASRMFGKPLKEKLSGSDLVPKLCAYAEKRGHSVYFFGGAPGRADESAAAMKARHPDLIIAGTDCPPWGFDKNPAQLAEAVAKIKAVKPTFLFVALGSPKQEYFMHGNGEEMGALVSIGIGGAFDFLSGRVRRAPVWMQQVGLEWLWRLLHEPRRLWKRYLVDDIVFFKLLWLEFRKSRKLRASPPEAR